MKLHSLFLALVRLAEQGCGSCLLQWNFSRKINLWSLRKHLVQTLGTHFSKGNYRNCITFLQLLTGFKILLIGGPVFGTADPRSNSSIPNGYGTYNHILMLLQDYHWKALVYGIDMWSQLKLSLFLYFLCLIALQWLTYCCLEN